MLHQLIDKLRNLRQLFSCLIKFVQFKNTNNLFVRDLVFACRRYGKRYDVLTLIEKKYRYHFNSINKNLYILLDESNDKDTFLRFFLKSFYGIDTATPDEILAIETAFSTVRKIYRERSNNYIEFSFRGKFLKYLMTREMREDETKAENILMNYYDVTHAFFLTEYEMDGFNPKDGKTILDCGAAYGDTLLAFRVLYPHSKIYSFEAYAENVEIIKKNIELNQIENIEIVQAFLYKDSKKHVLNNETGKIDDYVNISNKKEVKTLALDDFIVENSINDIGLIKFDIEGAEVPALNGAIASIKTQKPLLYIPIYHLDTDIYKIPEFLKELGMPLKLRIKWTEKKVWGVDCVLFVKFL